MTIFVNNETLEENTEWQQKPEQNRLNNLQPEAEFVETFFIIQQNL